MVVVPTLYEHYVDSCPISAGLSAEQSYFTLNEKNITLYSGALHYYRVPQEYWRDRLRKMRAAGLNAVETYIPWNLHEPEPGVYDFGNGGTDFEPFLDVEKFLKLAQEEDLFAIVRPGPYICTEWDFGGMPSWLLRDKDMKIRTSNSKFINRVESYFLVLFKILSVLQFTKGGPIIAFQIENEYGNVKVENEPIDSEYLKILKQLFIKNGIVELLFTSDTPSNGNFGSIPGILYTANFQNDTIKELDILKSYQANKPFMVMEYWTGWFDHWGEKHHVRSNECFSKELNLILNYPSSVNFYMFHGGTNWGFMNGANILPDGNLALDTSSYDYDAPLSEAGDYTDKYYSVKNLIKKYNSIHTKLPPMPKENTKIAYKSIKITHSLNLNDLIKTIPKIKSNKLLAMELLNINNQAGQSYGYIIYRKQIRISSNSILKISGKVCDTIMVLINGKIVSLPFKCSADLNKFGYWKLENSELNLGPDSHADATLDLVVENFGRNNFGKLNQFNQKKGIWQGDVSVNDKILSDFEIIPLEFKKKFNLQLHNFQNVKQHNGPAIYKASLIVDEPKDTFVDTRNWNKGIVIVNGFVLSRYFSLGPQQTAYLPAPLLRKGANDILFFEHFKNGEEIRFSDKPIFDTVDCL